jgi:SAM-dependent methyltransferase
MGLHPGFIPPHGKINFGDFNSLVPFSNEFGYDRGGPIDRYYIENFLTSESSYIKGTVLEIADNAYTLKYGGSKVTNSEVLHLYDTPGATYVGDLSKGDHLPSDHFDCIILTETLHLIYDYMSALKHCYRMLKKDGVLLVTVPGITSIDRGEWNENWLWSFNDHSMKKIFSELFPENSFKVQTYGNIYAAMTFLHGIGISEVDRSKLDVRDSAFDVVVTIRLKK